MLPAHAKVLGSRRKNGGVTRHSPVKSVGPAPFTAAPDRDKIRENCREFSPKP
jgi:hypothetical protein